MRRMKRYHVDESLHHTYHLGCLQWVVPRVTKLRRQVSGLYKAADAGGRRQPMGKGCEEKKNMWKDICVVILLILDFDFVWKWNHLPRTGDTYPHSLLASNTFHIKIQTSKNQGSRKVRLSSELTSVTGYSLTDVKVLHLWVNHIFALTFFWHCCSCNSILSDILLISQSLL